MGIIIVAAVKGFNSNITPAPWGWRQCILRPVRRQSRNRAAGKFVLIRSVADVMDRIITAPDLAEEILFLILDVT